MKKFVEYLIIEGTKRWGGFMAIGGHISVTQTDWHWILETLFIIGLDFSLVIGLYLEWKSNQIKSNEIKK
jgi:hypothetical protein